MNTPIAYTRNPQYRVQPKLPTINIQSSVMKLIEQRNEANRYANQQAYAQSLIPGSITDPWLNLKIRDYYRQKEEQTFATEVLGRAEGGAIGASLGAGLTYALSGLLATAGVVVGVVTEGTGSAVSAGLFKAAEAVAASAKYVAAAGATIGAATSDYTTYHATNSLINNTIINSFKKGVGAGVLNTLQVTGKSMDLIEGGEAVRAAIYALEKDESITDNILKAYGLNRKTGRIEYDYSAVREAQGIDLGGFGNTIYDLIGNIVTDPGAMSALGKNVMKQGMLTAKQLTKISDTFNDAQKSLVKKFGDKYFKQLVNLTIDGDKDLFIEEFTHRIKAIKDFSFTDEQIQELAKSMYKRIDDSIANNFRKQAFDIYSKIDKFDDKATWWLHRAFSPQWAGYTTLNKFGVGIDKLDNMFTDDSIKSILKKTKLPEWAHNLNNNPKAQKVLDTIFGKGRRTSLFKQGYDYAKSIFKKNKEFADADIEELLKKKETLKEQYQEAYDRKYKYNYNDVDNYVRILKEQNEINKILNKEKLSEKDIDDILKYENADHVIEIKHRFYNTDTKEFLSEEYTQYEKDIKEIKDLGYSLHNIESVEYARLELSKKNPRLAKVLEDDMKFYKENLQKRVDTLEKEVLAYQSMFTDEDLDSILNGSFVNNEELVDKYRKLVNVIDEYERLKSYLMVANAKDDAKILVSNISSLSNLFEFGRLSGNGLDKTQKETANMLIKNILSLLRKDPSLIVDSYLSKKSAKEFIEFLYKVADETVRKDFDSLINDTFKNFENVLKDVSPDSEYFEVKLKDIIDSFDSEQKEKLNKLESELIEKKKESIKSKIKVETTNIEVVLTIDERINLVNKVMKAENFETETIKEYIDFINKQNKIVQGFNNLAKFTCNKESDVSFINYLSTDDPEGTAIAYNKMLDMLKENISRGYEKLEYAYNDAEALVYKTYLDISKKFNKQKVPAIAKLQRIIKTYKKTLVNLKSNIYNNSFAKIDAEDLEYIKKYIADKNFINDFSNRVLARIKNIGYFKDFKIDVDETKIKEDFIIDTFLDNSFKDKEFLATFIATIRKSKTNDTSIVAKNFKKYVNKYLGNKTLINDNFKEALRMFYIKDFDLGKIGYWQGGNFIHLDKDTQDLITNLYNQINSSIKKLEGRDISLEEVESIERLIKQIDYYQYLQHAVNSYTSLTTKEIDDYITELTNRKNELANKIANQEINSGSTSSFNYALYDLYDDFDGDDLEVLKADLERVSNELATYQSIKNNNYNLIKGIKDSIYVDKDGVLVCPDIDMDNVIETYLFNDIDLAIEKIMNNERVNNLDALHSMLDEVIQDETYNKFTRYTAFARRHILDNITGEVKKPYKEYTKAISKINLAKHRVDQLSKLMDISIDDINFKDNDILNDIVYNKSDDKFINAFVNLYIKLDSKDYKNKLTDLCKKVYEKEIDNVEFLESDLCKKLIKPLATGKPDNGRAVTINNFIRDFTLDGDEIPKDLTALLMHKGKGRNMIFDVGSKLDEDFTIFKNNIIIDLDTESNGFELSSNDFQLTNISGLATYYDENGKLHNLDRMYDEYAPSTKGYAEDKMRELYGVSGDEHFKKASYGKALKDTDGLVNGFIEYVTLLKKEFPDYHITLVAHNTAFDANALRKANPTIFNDVVFMDNLALNQVIKFEDNSKIYYTMSGAPADDLFNKFTNTDVAVRSGMYNVIVLKDKMPEDGFYNESSVIARNDYIDGRPIIVRDVTGTLYYKESLDSSVIDFHDASIDTKVLSTARKNSFDYLQKQNENMTMSELELNEINDDTKYGILSDMLGYSVEDDHVVRDILLNVFDNHYDETLESIRNELTYEGMFDDNMTYYAGDYELINEINECKTIEDLLEYKNKISYRIKSLNSGESQMFELSLGRLNNKVRNAEKYMYNNFNVEDRTDYIPDEFDNMLIDYYNRINDFLGEYEDKLSYAKAEKFKLLRGSEPATIMVNRSLNQLQILNLINTSEGFVKFKDAILGNVVDYEKGSNDSFIYDFFNDPKIANLPLIANIRNELTKIEQYNNMLCDCLDSIEDRHYLKDPLFNMIFNSEHCRTVEDVTNNINYVINQQKNLSPEDLVTLDLFKGEIIKAYKEGYLNSQPTEDFHNLLHSTMFDTLLNALGSLSNTDEIYKSVHDSLTAYIKNIDVDFIETLKNMKDTNRQLSEIFINYDAIRYRGIPYQLDNGTYGFMSFSDLIKSDSYYTLKLPLSERGTSKYKTTINKSNELYKIYNDSEDKLDNIYTNKAKYRTDETRVGSVYKRLEGVLDIPKETISRTFANLSMYDSSVDLESPKFLLYNELLKGNTEVLPKYIKSNLGKVDSLMQLIREVEYGNVPDYFNENNYRNMMRKLINDSVFNNFKEVFYDYNYIYDSGLDRLVSDMRYIYDSRVSKLADDIKETRETIRHNRNARVINEAEDYEEALKYKEIDEQIKRVKEHKDRTTKVDNHIQNNYKKFKGSAEEFTSFKSWFGGDYHHFQRFVIEHERDYSLAFFDPTTGEIRRLRPTFDNIQKCLDDTDNMFSFIPKDTFMKLNRLTAPNVIGTGYSLIRFIDKGGNITREDVKNLKEINSEDDYNYIKTLEKDIEELRNNGGKIEYYDSRQIEIINAIRNFYLIPSKLASLTMSIPFIVTNATTAAYQNMREQGLPFEFFTFLNNTIKATKNYTTHKRMFNSLLGDENYSQDLLNYLSENKINWLSLFKDDNYSKFMESSANETIKATVKEYYDMIKSDKLDLSTLYKIDKYLQSEAALGEIAQLNENLSVHRAKSSSVDYVENPRPSAGFSSLQEELDSLRNADFPEWKDINDLIKQRDELYSKNRSLYKTGREDEIKYNKKIIEELNVKIENLKNNIDEYNKYRDRIKFLEKQIKNEKLSKVYSVFSTKKIGKLTNPLWKFNDINEDLEHIMRISMLDDAIESGATYAQATSKVISSHFVYTNKSVAEQMLELFIPFISYPLRFAQLLDDTLLGDYDAMHMLYLFDKSIWGNNDTSKSDYLTRRRTKGDISIGNKLVNIENPVLSSMMNITDPLYAINNKMNPLLKPSLDLLTNAEYNRYNQLPIIGQVNNVANVIRDEDLLTNFTNDFYRYPSSRMFLPNTRMKQKNPHFYNSLYTRSGYSRIKMNMQNINPNNLYYRVNQILNYGGVR